MIIVKMWGGLGNQMFQYAFGKALQLKYKDELYFDIGFYANQPSYTGSRKVDILTFFELCDFSVIERPSHISFFENRVVNKIIRYVPNFHFSTNGNINFVKEWQRHYMNDVNYESGKINYYDGYWLSERYFASIKEQLKKDFMIKRHMLNEITNINSDINGNSVAIHIRRGDYTSTKNLPKGYTQNGLLSYYHNAINYMCSHLDNPIFYFFSDDIEWCKHNFDNIEKKVFVQRKTEYPALADLFGIASCIHGIMSPSTFSWWGNWLRESSGKSIVIVPKGKYANNYFARDNWIEM